MSKDAVQDYWDSKAETIGMDLRATMRDVNLRKLEIDLLLAHLRSDDVALDVGCGNGIATVIFAEKAKQIEGIDLSAKMVEKARQLTEGTVGIKGRVSFRQMSVLDLSSYDEASFDVVISERCLINLADWDEQQRAILQIKRVLKPGGRFLMVEGAVQSLVRLNAMRKLFDLHAIEKHWHNVLFDEATLRDYLRQHFEVEQIRGMGTYYFISRVVHPALVAPQEPLFEARINEIAREIALRVESFDDISINSLYVLVKV